MRKREKKRKKTKNARTEGIREEDGAFALARAHPLSPPFPLVFFFPTPTFTRFCVCVLFECVIIKNEKNVLKNCLSLRRCLALSRVVSDSCLDSSLSLFLPLFFIYKARVDNGSKIVQRTETKCV